MISPQASGLAGDPVQQGEGLPSRSRVGCYFAAPDLGEQVIGRSGSASQCTQRPRRAGRVDAMSGPLVASDGDSARVGETTADDAQNITPRSNRRMRCNRRSARVWVPKTNATRRYS